ncbi:procathepsin L-like [Acipenser ruthenus]|uniref:procathepsin L-like n=1 Tax=Acipenser ruthenus TaxID=7906 RepID=UPI002742349F|nr:procathepsin L-like [Acipenser ruthenus]
MANRHPQAMANWHPQAMHDRAAAVPREGSCGSCWAFSATGAVEGQHFKKTGRLVSLSEQNLVECTKNKKYMNYGCNGGLMGRAFQYIIDNRGIASEQRYPYTGKDNKPCRYSASMNAARVSSYCRVPCRNEKALRDAVVAIGPISTCLNAGRRTFQFYRSVKMKNSGKQLRKKRWL